MAAINSNRVLKFKHWDVNHNMEKLSSGMRINKAGDDASGLAVSEKMRAQIKGLRQAERNAEDGMSFIQTAEGYLHQTAAMVHRIRTLSVQSSNGIYTQEDRLMIQVEVSQLIDEVDRIASVAEFNTLKLFQGDFSRTSRNTSMWLHIGANTHQRERIYVKTMTANALKMKNADGTNISLSTATKSNEVIGLMDEALFIVNKERANLGAYYNRMEYASKGLMSAYENIQASESRIRDVDMAEEMSDFTRNQILVQSGTAMVAQANAQSQTVLQLLR